MLLKFQLCANHKYFALRIHPAVQPIVQHVGTANFRVKSGVLCEGEQVLCAHIQAEARYLGHLQQFW